MDDEDEMNDLVGQIRHVDISLSKPPKPGGSAPSDSQDEDGHDSSPPDADPTPDQERKPPKPWGEEGYGPVIEVLDPTEFNPDPWTNGENHCFVQGTKIKMYPEGQNDIEEIRVGDLVTSYDKDGALRQGYVSKTFSRNVSIILDFHGLLVTPGHATLCVDGAFKYQHVALLDILRTDGAVAREDGQIVRASTGCIVGSLGDQLVEACTYRAHTNGRQQIAERSKLRFGTRFITEEGLDVRLMDIVEAVGDELTENGLITDGTSKARPFLWNFSTELPRPEDYILQRSRLTLREIYEASEWDDIAPLLPTPSEVACEAKSLSARYGLESKPSISSATQQRL